MSTLRRALERAYELTSSALSSSIFDGDAAACGLYNRRLPCLHLGVIAAQEMIVTAAQPHLRKIWPRSKEASSFLARGRKVVQ